MSKKFIAIISALALVVTLLAPVGVQEASAASKNKVDRTITVSSDTDISLPEYDGLRPTLLVEVDDKNIIGAVYDAWETDQVFRLELPSEAEWKYSTDENAAINTSGVVNAKVRKISNQLLEVKTTSALKEEDVIQIPMKVNLKSSASGEIKVTINPMDSRATGGSYTFAVVRDGNTHAHVGSKPSLKRGSNTAGTIIIDETTVGALGVGEHKIKLKLSKGVEWNSSMTGTTNFVSTTPDITVKGQKLENARDLEVTIDVDKATSRRQSITITTDITITRDANYGDVTVDLTSSKGDVTAQSGLVIGQYKDYGVEVEVKEVKEFLAGYHTDDYKTAKITVKETIGKSLVDGRVVEFELPSWVKVRDDVTITPTKGADYFTKYQSFGKGTKFEFEVSNTSETKKEIEFEIPLVIEADKSGDITLTVKGAGIESQEIIIGKAIAPVSVSIELADVRIGIQEQSAPEIIIEEAKAGAIRDGAFLDVGFANAIGFRFDSAKVEVIEGDLEIDLDKSKLSNRGTLQLYIDSDSTKPSKIKIYDIKMTVDRTAPEGPVKVDVAGSALVNYPADDTKEMKDFYEDFVTRVVRTDFANVITPAPGETRGTVVFTIDSTTYTVIESGKEVERTMDVAPYIKDSRTFLPVFFVAQALGVSEQNIVWEPHSKTVTIYKGDRIAQMQIGNKELTVNGVSISMDTAPEIKDGRTMLPIYFVGQALGASVEWDGDARTVTVNQ